MRYSNIKTSVLSQFQVNGGNAVVPFILGAPGGGKSACARDIVQSLGIENVVEFTASLRDPVDVLGVPDISGEYTRWVPPAEFYQLREGTGRSALILEELSDAPVPMQNALCGVIYDRRAGNLKLSDELFIIATGNRTEDKSGANRITSKLANRTRRFDFQENIDDWTEWALDKDIDPVLIQFLRFRPGLLSDFSADRFANPTPRAWERVNLIPKALDNGLFFDNCAGEVGEGAAAEYTGFKRIYEGLPSMEEILMSPATANVPADPATLYATMGALARKTTKDNADRAFAYLERVSPEFRVMCVKDVIKLEPTVKHSRAFVSWASANAAVLM
ncbi:hypothetical protein [Flavobacterium sp.]|jgi:hypothetical protein|uniref:hypothetical protein n=1 Tax=Flavobacterium sp. TaxID=239 RepID=UPI0037C15E89